MRKGFLFFLLGGFFALIFTFFAPVTQILAASNQVRVGATVLEHLSARKVAGEIVVSTNLKNGYWAIEEGGVVLVIAKI